MNKFEQISSLGHQMSLAERPCTLRSRLSKFEHAWGLGPVGQDKRGLCTVRPYVLGTGASGGSVYSEVPRPWGSLYSEVQCTMGNGHLGPHVDRQTHRHV